MRVSRKAQRQAAAIAGQMDPGAALKTWVGSDGSGGAQGGDFASFRFAQVALPLRPPTHPAAAAVAGSPPR